MLHQSLEYTRKYFTTAKIYYLMCGQVTKSTMEKKRRARINNSLIELKAILAGMVTHKGERFEKMEKADILEMTVDCVRQLQKQSRTGERMCTPSTSDSDYKSGIETCVGEVMRVLSSTEVDGAGQEMKSKLLTHISNRLGTSPNHSANFRSSGTAAISPRVNECSERQQFTTSPSAHAQTDNTANTDGVEAENIHEEDNAAPELFSVWRPPPLLPGTVPRQISPIQEAGNSDLVAAQSAAPNVPVTILVPANIYTTQNGGTFFIPVAFSGAIPYLSPQASALDSYCTTISSGINTVVSMPQVFGISPSYTSNSNTCSASITTNISPVIVYRDNTNAEDTTEHFAQPNSSQTQMPQKRTDDSKTISVPTVIRRTSTGPAQLTCSPVYTPVAKRLEPPQGCAILPKPPALNTSYCSQSYNQSYARSAFLHMNHDRGDAPDVSRARLSERYADPEQPRPEDHSVWRPW
ncbi:hairy/enhancer-of-split related with YRPW motif protein 2-like isoform X2 [Dreissena polymorpha]|uniref:Uncharacterized protein n=1 Tax=Dreissena polymorpha TaxID=45954 RepID=A0A9D4K112_DREPO|nr:hairy/enhancer-of-split related with YRPW motif protein 2-like isoform X2 [Dreissena polymorpha]KAH3827478.1 hypothetical protein DPMN_129413 [Dreissena polymorpha]